MAVWPYSTAHWRRLRLAKLAEQPTCEVCDRRGVCILASHVDHVVAIASGGEPFPPTAKLMSLCPSCHSVKTNAKDNPHAFGGGGGLAFKGCGVDGVPIDAEHPFFTEGYTPSKDEDPPAWDRRGAHKFS